MFGNFSLDRMQNFNDWRWQNGYSDPKDPQAQFDYQRYVQDTKTANDMTMLSWQMAVKQTQDILDMSRKLI